MRTALPQSLLLSPPRRVALLTGLLLAFGFNAQAQPQSAADELRDFGTPLEARLMAAYDRGEFRQSLHVQPGDYARSGLPLDDVILARADVEPRASESPATFGAQPAVISDRGASHASDIAAISAPPVLAGFQEVSQADAIRALAEFSSDDLGSLAAATREKAAEAEKKLEDDWDALAERAESTAALRARAVQLENLVAVLDRARDQAENWRNLRTPLPPSGAPWARHVIDAGLRKSEGIRLGDVNGDGKDDLLVAWEGQNISRVYLQPEVAQITAPWPVVEVGSTPEVEDSLLVDLDRDGLLDAVSSLEKGEERVIVHWGPGSGQEDHGCGWARGKGFDRTAPWQSAEFAQVRGITMWMYAAPIRLRPGGPVSLVVGGKNYKADASATLGLLIAPEQPTRDLSQWRWQSLTDASWVMSIEVADLDADGDEDIVFSDKHGPKAGVHWLRNPGTLGEPNAAWERTSLTSPDVTSANFITLADLDQDGLQDIVAVVELTKAEGQQNNYAHRRVLFLRRTAANGQTWNTHEILVPPGIGSGKGIAVGDIDLDGHLDIVLSSSGAEGELIGTSWLRYQESPFDRVWSAHNIAGAPGTKYDLVHLADLDQDGDLDVLANDEKQDNIGLGVFWYENPTR